MGQCNPLYLRVLAELHHVFNRTMAPANLGRILFGSVLRVVDEKIRAINKFVVSEIAHNFPWPLASMRECGSWSQAYTTATPSASNR